MKTIKFFLFVWMIFGATTMFSQNFKGGFSAGMTASEVSGDQAAGPNKLGMSLGVFTAFPLSDKSSIQMELLYIHKGSRVIPTERNNYSRWYRFHLEYVELPILYKHQFPLFSSTEFLQKLVLEAGLSYARLLRHNEVIDFDQKVPPGTYEDYYYNEGNIILGFHYPLSEKLNFNFRFSNSITPIRPHKGGANLWYRFNWGQYHTVWNLSVNYTL